MSVKDSDGNSFEDEFQIIDASCFASQFPQKELSFHLNFLCPVCVSIKTNFVCKKCVNSGSFTYSRNPTGPCYSELTTCIISIGDQIKGLDSLVAKRTPSNRATVEELRLLINSLTNNISFHVDQNQKKREREERLRQRMVRCLTSINQLAKKHCQLSKHSNSLHQRKKIMSKVLNENSVKIELLRTRYLRELLLSHFSVELSPDLKTADVFAGSALYVDKDNVFIGPEPQLSSHAALTYCVLAINASATFLSVGLPATLRKHLQLTGPFLASFPQRDNLGRVYSAVLHAVHMLCCRRGLNIPETAKELKIVLHSSHSQYNPLISLYCLARHTTCGPFDAPYVYSLNGFFGELSAPPPNSMTLQPSQFLEQFEIGEEVKSSWEASTGISEPDQLPAAENSNPRTVTVRSFRAHFSPSSSEYDPWEVIPVGSDVNTVVDKTVTDVKSMTQNAQ